jgi:hypothetical protein
MNMDEEEYDAYAYGSGCGVHGEDFLCECTLCGIEYCSACFRHSTLCADCAAQAAFDDEAIEPTEEEKDLLLADQFNDDEPSELLEEPAAPVKAPQKARAKAKPKPKAKPKAKSAPKAKAKPRKAAAAKRKA